MKKMKKLIGLLVFVAAFCFCIVAAPETTKADLAQDLVIGETVEIDYYETYFNVKLSKSGQLKLKFIPKDSDGETWVQCYDAAGEQIALWSYTGSFNATFNLQAGDYEFVIKDRTKNSREGDGGTLTTAFTDAKETYAEDFFKNNNITSSASKIKSVKKATIKGQLALNDTVDIYKFKLSKAKKLNVTFQSYLTNVELNIYNVDLDYDITHSIEAGTNKFSEVLPAGTYYMSFKNNASSGNYTLKVSTSDLKKTSLKTVKSPAKKQAKATWKKASGVTGYQIQIATNSKFTKGKKSYTTTKTSYTMKKLKSKKTYYVRIRTYTLAANGEKCYSDWSKVKKIKVK